MFFVYAILGFNSYELWQSDLVSNDAAEAWISANMEEFDLPRDAYLITQDLL